MKDPGPGSTDKKIYEKLKKAKLSFINSRFKLFKKDVLNAMESIKLGSYSELATTNPSNYGDLIKKHFSTNPPPVIKCLNKSELVACLKNYMKYKEATTDMVEILNDLSNLLDGAEGAAPLVNMSSYTRKITNPKTLEWAKAYCRRYEPAIVLFFETIFNKLINVAHMGQDPIDGIHKNQTLHFFKDDLKVDEPGEVGNQILNIIRYNDDSIKKFFGTGDNKPNYIIDTTHLSEMTGKGLCTIAGDWDAAIKSCEAGKDETGKNYEGKDYESQLVAQAFTELSLKTEGTEKVEYKDVGKNATKDFSKIKTSVGALSKCVFDDKSTEETCKPFGLTVRKDEVKYYLDFKRTGDAYQVLMVKKLNDSRGADKPLNVFVTIDHLAFLKARMVGVPAIYSLFPTGIFEKVEDKKCVILFNPGDGKKTTGIEYLETQYKSHRDNVIKFINPPSPDQSASSTMDIDKYINDAHLDTYTNNKVKGVITKLKGLITTSQQPIASPISGVFTSLKGYIESTIGGLSFISSFNSEIGKIPDNILGNNVDKTSIINSFNDCVKGYLQNHLVAAAVIDAFTKILLYQRFTLNKTAMIKQMQQVIEVYNNIILPEESSDYARYEAELHVACTEGTTIFKKFLQMYGDDSKHSFSMLSGDGSKFIETYKTFITGTFNKHMNKHMKEFTKMMGGIKYGVSSRRIPELKDKIMSMIDKFIKSTLLQNMQREVTDWIHEQIECDYMTLLSKPGEGEIGEIGDDVPLPPSVFDLYNLYTGTDKGTITKQGGGTKEAVVRQTGEKVNEDLREYISNMDIFKTLLDLEELRDENVGYNKDVLERMEYNLEYPNAIAHIFREVGLVYDKVETQEHGVEAEVKQLTYNYRCSDTLCNKVEEYIKSYTNGLIQHDEVWKQPNPYTADTNPIILGVNNDTLELMLITALDELSDQHIYSLSRNKEISTVTMYTLLNTYVYCDTNKTYQDQFNHDLRITNFHNSFLYITVSIQEFARAACENDNEFMVFANLTLLEPGFSHISKIAEVSQKNQLFVPRQVIHAMKNKMYSEFNENTDDRIKLEIQGRLLKLERINLECATICEETVCPNQQSEGGSSIPQYSLSDYYMKYYKPYYNKYYSRK
jgi:hypothetical protein